MNKKILGTTISFAAAAVLLFPKPVSAFWPLDLLRGQVLGVQTETNSFFSAMQNMFKKFGISPSATGTGSVMYKRETDQGRESPRFVNGTARMMFPPVSEEKLTEAVNAGKITAAQKSEILARLAAIKAKREELTKLEQSFREWLMANKIPTGIFVGKVKPTKIMMQQNIQNGQNRQYDRTTTTNTQQTPPQQLNNGQMQVGN